MTAPWSILLHPIQWSAADQPREYCVALCTQAASLQSSRTGQAPGQILKALGWMPGDGIPSKLSRHPTAGSSPCTIVMSKSLQGPTAVHLMNAVQSLSHAGHTRYYQLSQGFKGESPKGWLQWRVAAEALALQPTWLQHLHIALFNRLCWAGTACAHCQFHQGGFGLMFYPTVQW